LLFLFFTIIGSLSKKEVYAVKANTVLHLQLNKPITENGKVNLNPLNFTLEGSTGLADFLYGIERAKTDKNIAGIFLEVDNLMCGYATAKEIRRALASFQQSGKFVTAYNKGEAITLKEYYLSSVAKENYGFPSSMMEFGGLGVELMYYKNMLDELDIEMQVIRGKNNDF
jgi:hypothetical protein